MARAETTKLYRTFVKGLVTEAGPLTYPEDATIDEDNCVIYRAGNRSRRLGIDIERAASSSSSVIDKTTYTGYAVTEYRWDSVNNNAATSFIVVQTGLTLRFFNANSEVLLDGEKSFTVDLTPYIVSGTATATAAATPVSMAHGKGILFVVGEYFEPFFVEYNSTFDTVSTTQIHIQIRDFKGISDGYANDQEPATLSDPHHYNLRNQGWLDATNSGAGSSVTYYNPYGGTGTYNQAASTPITSYFTTNGRYPSNSQQWWVAKDSTTGSFDPALLVKEYFGTTLAPRGHYVVNAFNIDRSAVSGVPNIPVETLSRRPVSVAFANGRVWYALDSTVYFSQVLTDKGKAGLCYQEADPTSEHISDLIATDGGEVPIPEMTKALKLVPVGSGMVIFAKNGLWFVGGTQAGFSALDISVNKVSSIGTESPGSIIDVDDTLYWWSKIGIQALAQKQGMFGTVEGIFDKQTITETTIQTFYNDISDEAKRYVKSVYDPQTNVIQWLYKSEDITQNYLYDKVLNLDLTLQAFYPWTISTDEDYPYVAGAITTPVLAGYDGDLNVTVRQTFIKYLTVVPELTNYRLNWSQFNSIEFGDWPTFGDPLQYTSFMESGYELADEAMRKKQTPWVLTYFKKTEENFIADGDDYTTDRQSSCYFQVKWDWASSSSSNKYSTKRQAYRHTRVPFVDEANPVFDTGFSIVVTKHKVRGSGKSIQFRFECDELERDFDLLGWSAALTGNTKV